MVYSIRYYFVAIKNIVWVFHCNNDQENEDILGIICQDVYSVFGKDIRDSSKTEFEILDFIKIHFETVGAKKVFGSFASLTEAREKLFKNQPFVPICCFYLMTDESKESVFQELEKQPKNVKSLVLSKTDEIYISGR